MVMRNDELLAQALSLPRDAREDLAERLLRSVDDDEQAPESASAAWDREIVARLQRYDAGTEAAVPWDELRDRLEQRRTDPPR